MPVLSVGPVGPVVITIRSITILGWLVTIFAAIPIGPAVPPDVSRLAIGVAIVGSFKYLMGKAAKPAHEVYLAGKEMGRRELLLEQADVEHVVSLDDRRRVRDASKGERAVGGGRWLS